MKRFFKKLFGAVACVFGTLGAASNLKAAEPQPPVKLADFQDAGQLICAWNDGSAKDVIAACEKLGFTITGGSLGNDWVVCSWKNGLKPETLAELQKVQGVRYVEPNFARTLPSTASNDGVGPRVGRVAVAPKDEFFSQLYGMKSIRATEAWRTVKESPTIVAVLDTGVDYTHEDLKANMWINPKRGAKDVHGADFIETMVEIDRETGKTKVIFGNDPMDKHYHGTHVAGTIGAVGDNGIGVTGVNWSVQIMAVRCLGANGRASTDSVANSIRYAVDNGAKVLNLSIGGRNFSQTEFDMVKYAASKGAILVCAAGNKSDKDLEIDNDKLGMFPANYNSPNIVSVANIDVKENLNLGSHLGKKSVHIAGPGTDILSTFPMKKTEGMLADEKEFKISFRTKYDLLTGTSMATPHVAGAIALAMGHPAFKGRSAAEVRDAILKNARKLDVLKERTKTGGTLDLTFLAKTDAPIANPPVDSDDAVNPVEEPAPPVNPVPPVKPVIKPIDNKSPNCPSKPGYKCH